MGMYTGVRFKGIIKEEFRNNFEDIALRGEWSNSNDLMFKRYSKNERAGFIPCGSISYMPDEWETDYLDENGKRVPYFEHDYGKPEEEVRLWEQKATDGFDRGYNELTGCWTFQCSLKNYWDTIDEFFELLPYFVESIEHLECYYEEWNYSHKYELVDNKVVCTDYRFKEYR